MRSLVWLSQMMMKNGMTTIEEEVKEEFTPQTVEPTTTDMFDVLLDPKRKEGETFHDYKDRQKLANKFVKAYKKGRLSWNPYILKPMGITTGLPLTEKNREFLQAVADRMKKKQENNE